MERIYLQDYRELAFKEENIVWHFEGVTAEGEFKYVQNEKIWESI